MAIFEKSFHTKSAFDDTDTLICTLENAQNVDKHTVSILFRLSFRIKCFSSC